MDRLRTVLAGLAMLATVAAPGAAQDYTIHSATTFKMGGALGFAARLAGGGKETLETTYVSGHKMRTETADNATIVDVDAGSITTINNKDKTYFTMTFDQMADMMRQMQAQAARQKPEASKSSQDPNVAVKYSAQVDATGKQQTIAGMKAKQVLLTLTMDAAARPEEGKDMQKAGSVVVLVDMWNTEDAPHARALKEFQQAYAAKAKSEFGSSSRGMEGMLAAYPGAAEGLQAAAKEMKKVPGVSVRTVTHLVLVPPDKKFDPELALADAQKAEAKKDDDSGKGIGGLMARLKAQSQANQQNAKSDDTAQMQQSTLLTMTTEVRDAQAGGVPAAAFSIPQGYKEKTPRM